MCILYIKYTAFKLGVCNVSPALATGQVLKYPNARYPLLIPLHEVSQNACG